VNVVVDGTLFLHYYLYVQTSKKGFINMTKTLVIVAHPNMKNSRFNKRLRDELTKTDVTIHDLYETYPDENIDIAREQELLLTHDRIVLQFPFYWYSSPSLLKKWQDHVLAFGWAYGPGGTKLHGKELMLAITTGGPEAAYQAGGYNQYAMSELLKPFQATSNLIGARYLPAFIIHGVNQLTEQQVNEHAARYVEHIAKDFGPRR
jgi:glutathione-regulated potassium-efflux system ancillary protein KefG